MQHVCYAALGSWALTIVSLKARFLGPKPHQPIERIFTDCAAVDGAGAGIPVLLDQARALHRLSHGARLHVIFYLGLDLPVPRPVRASALSKLINKKELRNLLLPVRQNNDKGEAQIPAPSSAAAD
jgi:hypothetical protein